jgi:hypothetical protein
MMYLLTKETMHLRLYNNIQIRSAEMVNWLYIRTRTYCMAHRVYRVPGFLPSRPNLVPPPHPLTRKRVLLPLNPLGSETHSLGGKGGGGNADEGTNTLVLYVCYNPSPLYGNPKKELRKRAFPGKYTCKTFMEVI